MRQIRVLQTLEADAEEPAHAELRAVLLRRGRRTEPWVAPADWRSSDRSLDGPEPARPDGSAFVRPAVTPLARVRLKLLRAAARSTLLQVDHSGRLAVEPADRWIRSDSRASSASNRPPNTFAPPESGAQWSGEPGSRCSPVPSASRAPTTTPPCARSAARALSLFSLSAAIKVPRPRAHAGARRSRRSA